VSGTVYVRRKGKDAESRGSLRAFAWACS